jgi:hypothetical protein
MVSYGIMIIIVVVFFAGIGIGYVIFPSSTSTAPMMTPQQMMNDPQIMDSWMDTIVSEPKLRQQIVNKMSQETTKEFQESEESPLLEKQDLRVMLLKQMEVHNQDLANLAPFYTDDPNLNEMMNEKMIEHNHLMNQLLNQETMGPELDESIKKHMEEHQQMAEQISSLSQNG